MKIAVGLSGGVDSAVAAYLLKKEGHEIIGITMSIWDEKYKTSGKRSACLSSDEEHDIEDIIKICSILDIPFHKIDLVEDYDKIVLDYFKKQYLDGKTPNPCVICNSRIKFDLLLRKAKESGIDFDYFATGHYAKIHYDKDAGLYILKKAKYLKKDQSYFLAFLKQEQLSKVLFPLGDLTKEEVREIARECNLPVHDKEESMDFFSGDYKEIINTTTPGNIVDLQGKILGRHNGIINYTVGQRKGLTISNPTQFPMYVIKINKDNNTVIVGMENNLFTEKFIVKDVNWISISPPLESIEANVRIRYKHEEAFAKIVRINETDFEVSFLTPQKAITPGQIAVFYKDDIVLGGGTIEL